MHTPSTPLEEGREPCRSLQAGNHLPRPRAPPPPPAPGLMKTSHLLPHPDGISPPSAAAPAAQRPAQLMRFLCFTESSWVSELVLGPDRSLGPGAQLGLSGPPRTSRAWKRRIYPRRRLWGRQRHRSSHGHRVPPDFHLGGG